MIKYQVCLNNGNENIGLNEKTITVNEIVDTCDENALAREINHANPLIPIQVAKSVLENFCSAAANLMAMGFAVQLKSGNNVALRIYPDVHVKEGSINLARARQLDSTVTELTPDNAGELVSKAGVTLRVKAESLGKFTELLQRADPGITRTGFVERPRVVSGGSGGNSGGNTGGGTGGNGGGNSGGSGGGDEEGI
jgi:uncharacterized membrane protein YgcG